MFLHFIGRWIVYGLAYIDEKEVINEYAVKALAEFVFLHRDYDFLLKSKKGWKSTFNADNIEKILSF